MTGYLNETARAWRIKTMADLPVALTSAWNRYAVERSTDAFDDVAKLIELGNAMNASEEIAKTFSTVLRNWLTADEMAEVIADNHAETSSNVCHSHDFCDANMAMMEAFTAVTGMHPIDATDQAAADLWNAAWDLAKANDFYVAS